MINCKKQALSISAQQVIAALIYFDLFQYPLKKQEIMQFIQKNNTKDELVDVLLNLEEKKLIFKLGDFYSLQSDENVASTRKIANQRAIDKMDAAKKYSRLIASFPYVRAVLLSGTISKDVMHEDSDIDFFIITESGRLWVAKLLMILYKKVFLWNSHKHFCINYFINVDFLEIEEKNLFTATELVTLIPTYGYDLYQKLMQNNNWAKQYYPNFPLRDESRTVKTGIRKKLSFIIEKLLNNPFGDYLDKKFLDISWSRYNRLYRDKLSPEEMKIAFKSKPHVSKGHGLHFQKKILDNYKQRVSMFEQEHNVILSQ